MATTGEITTVPAGESVRLGLVEQIAAPACDDKHGGCWACITHDEAFPTQLGKDGHIADGDHCMAWVCFAHGLEAP